MMPDRTLRKSDDLGVGVAVPPKADVFEKLLAEERRLHEARCIDPEVCVDDKGSQVEWVGCSGWIRDAAYRAFDQLDAFQYALSAVPRNGEDTKSK